MYETKHGSGSTLMATTKAVKEAKELKLNRNYRKTQHAWGVIPPKQLEAWEK